MKIKNVAVFCLLIASQFVNAQTVDDIINQYFENTGGRENWSKITSMRSTAKVKAQGMEFPTIMLSKPDRQKISFVFQGMTMVQPAFDGTTGWQTNFMNMKAEKMEADDNEITKAEAADFPDPFLRYKEKGYTAELQGNETIEGTDCFKVKLTKKPVMIDGKEEENATIYFFDKENYVPIMARSVVKKGPAKGKNAEATMSDYQEVGGLMLPFSLEQKFEGQTMASIAIEKIELNVEIDEKEFAFPESNE